MLEDWVYRRGWSWGWVTAAATLLPVLLFAAAAWLDGLLDELTLADLWNVLFVPTLIAYTLGIQPLMGRRFDHAMNFLRPRLVLSEEDFVRMIARSKPRRRWEWLSLGVGAALGILLERPWGQFPFWEAIVFGIFGQALVFGLIGWFLFTTLNRTQLLGYVHRRPLEPGADPEKIDPMLRWSLEAAASFLGLFLLTALFLRQHVGGATFFLYGGLLLVIVIAVLLNRAVSAVLSSVYQSRILYSLILLSLTAVAGTLGYQALEGWSWMDGLYMTIITMTTVGYGETHDLTRTGMVFTMILVVTSIGIAGYAISTVAGYVVEGEFNRIFRSRRMDKRISKLNNHVILCGAGRIGREIAGELYKTLTPFLIIEPNPEVLNQIPFLDEVPYLQEDATRDETLRRAGVDRARGLLATLSDDQANVFLVLSVRALNPKLRIIARLANDENRKKLLRAGADDVVHTEAIGGLRMASMMIRPSVVTFLDQMLRVTGETLRVEEVRVTDSMAGRSLDELKVAEQTGLLVMAFKPIDKSGYQFNPPQDTTLQSGDVLIVMGTPKQLAKVNAM